MTLHEGAIVAGRYQLESRVGQGGMGAVWRARHLELGSAVAIKLIEESSLHSEDSRVRFRREAKLVAALHSPHVVQVFDYGVDGHVPYLVMELLEGESLAERLERSPRLPPGEVLRILTPVARAMSKAHDAGIVHRDLKPQNIFLARYDDEDAVKVLDFGIAKAPEASHISATASNALLGTAPYMSPEQAQGAGNVDYRTDLWALGVVAYQCIVGSLPFQGVGFGDVLVRIMTVPTPVPSQFATVPEGFDAWFAKACAKDPRRRFLSAREMVDALEAVLGPRGASLSSADASPAFTMDGAERPRLSNATTVATHKPVLLRRVVIRAAFATSVLLAAGGAILAWSLAGNTPAEPVASAEAVTAVASVPPTGPTAAPSASAALGALPVDNRDLPANTASGPTKPSAGKARPVAPVRRPASTDPSTPSNGGDGERRKDPWGF
jgi:serine/threonine-protein kinase